MTRTREIHLVRYPVSGVSAADFEVADVALEPPAPGQVLVRNSWTSVDPGLRLRVAEHGPPGYFPAFPLHRALDGIMAVGKVVESAAGGFAPGDTVWHAQGWREHAVVDAGAVALGGLGTLTKLDVESIAPRHYLGPLGGMGLTAYLGLVDAARLREGDIVWVSAAAGAVGSLAAQFARLLGHRAIGSAGSPDKVEYLLNTLRLDAAFDYNAGPVEELLREAAPDGIDVYFDSVGGEHLEAALSVLRPFGRVALCGAISNYERAVPMGPRNLFQATANSLTLQGFRGSAYSSRVAAMQQQVRQWLAAGRLHVRETVYEGLGSAPQALVDVLAGRTLGKTMVHLP